MKWYIAKLVFAIRSSRKRKVTEFDEQLRLISARNENEAFLKARLIGVREEEHNDGEYNAMWEFVDVIGLSQFEMKDGAEVSSGIRELEYVDSYISYVYQQARNIEAKTKLNLVAVE